jgi:hypothetical protein
MAWTITLADGCLTATLNSPTLSTINVNDGETQTLTFADVGDTYGSSISTRDFCGLRTYEV